MDYIVETKKTPIIAKADVVVLGGGPSGVAAAVCAARLGAEVILVERYGYFGGQATGGLVIEFFGAHDGTLSSPGRPIMAGLYQEVLDRLKAMGAVTRFPDVLVHPEVLKLVYQRLLLEEGVNPLAHTWAVGAVVEDDTAKTVLVESKSGRGAIIGQVFVDGTGDGDSAEWCQVPYEKMPREKLRLVTLVYRFGNVDVERAEKFKENKSEYAEILTKAKEELGFWLAWNRTMNPGEVWTDEAHIRNIDCTNAEDLMKSEFQAREMAYAALQFYRQNVPGFKNASWVDTAPQMGIRESRRIRSKYWLTSDDLKAERDFEDTVVYNQNRILGPGHVFAIPYRCLVPQGVKNLLFTGRCIGVAHNIMDWIREIPSCTCLGQAAGTSAALALNAGCDVGAVDAAVLRKTLVDSGAIVGL